MLRLEVQIFTILEMYDQEYLLISWYYVGGMRWMDSFVYFPPQYISVTTKLISYQTNHLKIESF